MSTVQLRCTDAPETIGRQDYVFVTLKATGLLPAATQIATLMDSETALITGINGVPYWYFYGIDSSLA